LPIAPYKATLEGRKRDRDLSARRCDRPGRLASRLERRDDPGYRPDGRPQYADRSIWRTDSFAIGRSRRCSGATIDGNVYGLSFYEGELNLADPSYLRSVTFDGEVPEIDEATGFDTEPDTGYLIDPATGVRLERDEISGNLNPVDPETGSQLTDSWGDPLIWSADTGLTDPLGNPYQVDMETGELIGPAEAGEG
jgi:hypothetical protein